MKIFFSLLKKDLMIEGRGKETLALMLSLSVLLSVIVSFGVGSAFFDSSEVRRIFPAFLWVVFVFTATVSVGQSYGYELEEKGIEGLLLSGVSPTSIYLSKVVSNFLVVSVGHLFAMAILSVLLDVEIFSVIGSLILLSVLVVGAYSSLSTLLAAMASTSRLKNMLLPLILLPLLFPMFFAAIELTADVMENSQMDPGSIWLSLLIALNVVYIVLGVNLYDYVVRE